MSAIVTWDNCVLVIRVGTRSESIHYRAYADHVGSSSLIDWAIAKLRSATERQLETAILAAPAECARVRSAVTEEPAVAVIPASGFGDVYDLYRLGCTRDIARILLVDLAAALLPPSSFASLMREHVTGGHQATILDGVPSAGPPLLVEAEVVTDLATSGSRGIPHSLTMAIARLSAAPRPAAQRLRVQMIPVGTDAAAAAWPVDVSLSYPDDVAILRRVALRAGGSSHTVDLLALWNDAAREERRQRDPERAKPIARSVPPGVAVLRTRPVLFVQSPSAFTGVEQVLRLLVEGLKSREDGPVRCAAMLSLSGVLSDALSAAGADVTVAQRDFAAPSVEHYAYGLRELRHLDPALVHSHSIVGLPLCCAMLSHGAPFVQHVHVAAPNALAVLADQMTLASSVIAVSEFVRGRIVRMGIDPEKVRVVHNGLVPQQRDERTAARARLKLRRACAVPDEAKVMLVVGRYAPNKRHDIAIETFVRARARISDLYLLLAGEALGDGQTVFERVKRDIQQHGVQDLVRILGFRQDMPALYAGADVLVLPSEDDPLPMTIMEAMAARLPVVAARSGGIPEMITDQVCGVLAEPGDPQDFVTGVEQVLENPDVRERLTCGGLERCRAQFTLSRFVSQVFRVYEDVLALE